MIRIYGTVGLVVAFFALNGLAIADSERDDVLVSNRIQTTVATNWQQTGVPGPVVLAMPGFGELFVAFCGVGAAANDSSSPLFGFRNKSDRGIDVVGLSAFAVSPSFEYDADNVLEPGEEATLVSAITSLPPLTTLLTFQLGSGLSDNWRVATVVASAALQWELATCRFQAQAVVHRMQR